MMVLYSHEMSRIRIESPIEEGKSLSFLLESRNRSRTYAGCESFIAPKLMKVSGYLAG